MDKNTLIQVVVALVVGGVSGFITAMFRVSSYISKVDRLEEDAKDIKKDLKEIRDKVIACETSLKEREPLTKRKSPVSLTDSGKKLLNNSKADKFIDENFDDLYKKIEDKKPKTAYDIQELSKEVLKEIKNEDKFIVLKDFAFKEGIEIDDIILVASFYLRDKVLEKKTNLN